MKYLKLFESFDDSDTMARYQLFEAMTTMAFDFNSEYITDKESIKDLIEKYNEFYVSGKSWSGGPPPKYFIEYFNKNHSKKGGASLKTFYPTIDLMIETPDYGTLIVGFSIINKSYKLFNWGSLTDSNNSSPDYDKSVLSEISRLVREDISKMSLDQVIDTFQLNIKNKVEWEWKSWRYYNESYKLFESKENEFLIEDLFGVEPMNLRDVITSLLDELDVPQFEIRYSISSLFNLNKEWRHLVETDDFSWQYELFIDNEKGLNKVDYDMWEKFRTDNNIPYELFGASINVICFKQHNNDFDELSDVINFINDGLSEYKLNVRAAKKFSGFLIPDFGTTGYMIQLVDKNMIEE